MTSKTANVLIDASYEAEIIYRKDIYKVNELRRFRAFLRFYDEWTMEELRKLYNILHSSNRALNHVFPVSPNKENIDFYRNVPMHEFRAAISDLRSDWEKRVQYAKS